MRSTSASPSTSLLDELETALAHGSVARRVETLRRVTDLFLHGAVDYSDEQIAVFDDVFHCLILQLESTAKSLLAGRLAPVPTAPPRIIRTLAFDDAVEVAAPVLSQSERLDDIALIEAVRSRSQGHLLAISQRRVLSGAVTDALIERGNDEVLRNTVDNAGAAFTEHGYNLLVGRAEGDDNLATCIGLRPSIPRHHYLKLVAKASSSVRARLEVAHPDRRNEVSNAVQEAVRRARSAPEATSRETIIAHGLVRSLFEDGRLDESQLAAFAEAGKFDETNAALACLTQVPVALVETMMVEASAEGVLILSKVAGISWTATKAIIQMRDALSESPQTDLDACKLTYERLRPSTAQQVLRFHRMQQQTASSTVSAA